MSNDWTNKLRDRLTDYQEPVTDDLWAAIQQSLAQQKSHIVSIGKSVDSPDAPDSNRPSLSSREVSRPSASSGIVAIARASIHLSKEDV